MSEAKQPAKPIVDVAQPGKTAPPLTSKPVLVSNRAMLKDPMVISKTEEEPPKEDTVTVKTARSGQTVAATEAVANPEVEPKTEQALNTTPEPVLKPDESAPKSEPEAPAKEDTPPAEKKESSESTESNEASDKQAIPTDAQIEAAAAAEAAHDATIQKLVDSKQYFVSVNAVEKRRTKRVVALGVALSIILALAWVDVALDAGLIQIGSVKPVTHFFSN